MTAHVRESRRAVAIGIALGVCLAARAAPATEAAYYEVAQPMFDEGSGCVRVQHVTYQLWVGSSFPGREIDLTCAFGPVVVNPGLRVITRENVADHNIARAMGISVSTETKDFDTWKHSSDPAHPGTYVDTLAVQLDVRLAEAQMLRKSFRDSLLVEPWVLDKTVEASMACLLENGGRSEIPIRRLRIRVIGAPRFRKLSGVFRIPARIERTFCETTLE